MKFAIPAPGDRQREGYGEFGQIIERYAEKCRRFGGVMGKAVSAHDDRRRHSDNDHGDAERDTPRAHTPVHLYVARADERGLENEQGNPGEEEPRMKVENRRSCEGRVNGMEQVVADRKTEAGCDRKGDKNRHRKIKILVENDLRVEPRSGPTHHVGCHR